jgi:ABC-type nitrate/sulfonate/bicarbonate transport system permease component
MAAMTRRKPSVFRPNGPIVLGTIGIAAILGIWQILASTGIINPVIASSPARVFAEFGPLWENGQLASALLASGGEFAIALAISLALGVGFGLVMYSNRVAEYALDPVIWFVYSAPVVTLYPLFIIWFGLGAPAAIATAVILAFVPVAINTKAGLESTDRLLVRVARAFGASDRYVIWHVVVPYSIPLMMAGIRLAVGRVIIGVIVGEVFGSNKGFGYLISYYGSSLKTTDVLVSLCVLVVAGIAITQAVRILEDWCGRWRLQSS